MSPRSPNPLDNNKVYHADIHFTDDGGDPQDLSGTSPNREEEETQKRAAEMHMWWDEAIAKHMNLPDGYQNVAVLIVKWADMLDELKTKAEAEELDAVFRDNFHFETEIIELNVSSKPQHQLNRYLSAFVEKHDGPHNLMIVYYTGHGLYKDHGGYLELTGSTNPKVKKGFNNDARCNWNKAEEILKDDEVEGDVLTILDTCFSSNLVKSGKEDTRTYELLSACAMDETTASPGDNSFTRALIDALKSLAVEFADKSFSTSYLNQRINLNPNRRDTPSHLWFRLRHADRHIRLAPLKPEKDRLREVSRTHPPRGYLTLRFAIQYDLLNREQIEFLTHKLSKALNNNTAVGLRRIDWLGIKPARATRFGRTALAMFAIAQWRSVLHRRREEKKLQRRVDEIELPIEVMEGQEEVLESSPTRKRTRDDADDYPEPKRELLVPQLSPPSPPVSDSGLRVEV
ncbi:hypothetical protein K469DRAFT_719303 [Zopfia rhizophila CBS 207.26]|uniref:Uncharacterized protein n=1 Tax=Zopfia rhizophila CBS 207.26 TaxID=1314779 RepID=A0A6A6DFB5_9PEZI|nr:hypothetical protein K469DRAFT_719303 [Zopfia rhizophila CBS 207.26]